MRKMLTDEHSGVGGMYFLMTMVICSFIMYAGVRLAWDSQAIAMADNIAYITSINVSVNGYLDNVKIPHGTYNGYLPQLTNHPYNPLADFNRMLKDAGLVSNSGAALGEVCQTVELDWDGKRTWIQYGSFRSTLGTRIRPHEQESVIEVN